MALMMCYKNNLTPKINYINPNQPPPWFTDLSPTGSVPMLQADDKVIFESLVIIEFLNDISADNSHPSKTIDVAINRAWMSFATSLLTDLFALVKAKTQDEFDKAVQTLNHKLQKVSKQHSGNQFFNNDKFSLVDIAFTPLLMRLNWLNQASTHRLNILPDSLIKWQENLLAQNFVQQSVDDDLEDTYLSFVEQFDGVLASLLKEY